MDSPYPCPQCFYRPNVLLFFAAALAFTVLVDEAAPISRR